MGRITVQVDSERDWRAAAAAGPDSIQLTYRCPRCQEGQEIRLQLGPWSTPAPDTGHETFAGPDGHLQPGFAEYETARAAGELEHEDTSQLVTQLWCHRCQIGADVTVNA